MNTKQDYIAVLDSGLGGLSVLRHLRRRMPGERFVYYGDSAHAPYGTRSHAEVEALTMNAAAHLMSYGLKALVVACNTATAAAIIPSISQLDCGGGGAGAEAGSGSLPRRKHWRNGNPRHPAGRKIQPAAPALCLCLSGL